jgi:hypothetical protein
MFRSWIKSVFSDPRHRSANRAGSRPTARPSTYRPRLESLEGRLAPAAVLAGWPTTALAAHQSIEPVAFGGENDDGNDLL